MKKHPKICPIPAPDNYELHLNHQIEALAEKLNEVTDAINIIEGGPPPRSTRMEKIKRMFRKIELFYTEHWTYCDGCKRFSPQWYCPHCK